MPIKERLKKGHKVWDKTVTIEKDKFIFLLEQLDKIEHAVPALSKDSSEYVTGYHTCLMYVKKAVQGDEPFTINLDNIKASLLDEFCEVSGIKLGKKEKQE